MKINSLERNWILYDVGNSAFTLLSTTILPLYFNSLASKAGISSTDYLAYWGYALSFVTFVVAIIGPTLGALSDGKDMRIKIFSAFVIIGVTGNLIMAIPMNWLTFLIDLIIAKIAYASSLVFYDSMLTDVTTPEKMDSISSHGFAWGYLGSCVPFILSLVIILKGSALGLSNQASYSIALIINAVWWLTFSLPLIKTYKQTHFIENRITTGEAWKVVKETFQEILANRKVLYFLVAFFFYIDGVYTIINMAVAYGGSMGLSSTGLLIALLVTQLVAFPFALIFSKLSSMYDTPFLIKICIIAYFFITLFAVQLDKLWEFWTLAVFVGMFQGAIQALSRSFFGKIIPANKSGKYFGIYDICGKGASLLGTFLVSFIAQLTDNQGAGIAILPVMFAVGLYFFNKSVIEK